MELVLAVASDVAVEDEALGLYVLEDGQLDEVVLSL